MNPVVQTALWRERHRLLEDVGELCEKERQEVDGWQRVQVGMSSRGSTEPLDTPAVAPERHGASLEVLEDGTEGL